MKPFTTLMLIFILVIALGHVGRLLFGWSVVIEGISIPLWMSGAAAVFLLILVAMVWQEHRKAA